MSTASNPSASPAASSLTHASSLTQPVNGQKADRVFRGVAYACGILILVTLAAVALFLLFRAWPLIGGDQQANSAVIENFTGGKATSFWGYVGPLLFGTVLVAALALVLAFFVSIGLALFISHDAPKRLAAVLRYIVDLLVRHRARGGARACARVLRLDRHRAVHLALRTQAPRGGAQLPRRHPRRDPLGHLRPMGRPRARASDLPVLELDRRIPRLDPTVRRAGREPAAHRGDRGARARDHDPADHHVEPGRPRTRRAPWRPWRSYSRS